MKKHIYLLTVIYSLATIMISISTAQDSVHPTISFIAVAPDINLEVIEWGGHGEPLILLAGLGHSAHVFDEFAPLLADHFRVLGITRRGFGASSQPGTGYDLPTLVQDIVTALDSLKIEQAILVGHSLAGDELTKLASIYPNRVKALVFLDAAYDHIAQRDTFSFYPVPGYESPQPTATDLTSPEAYQKYYLKAEGVLMPLSEIRAINVFGEDGKFEGRITPGWIYGEITKGLEHPDYAGIEIPALAIYAVSYPITELFTHYDSQDSTTKIQMQERFELGVNFDAEGRWHFKRQMKNAKIIELEGVGHSLYITHSEEVANLICMFIDKL